MLSGKWTTGNIKIHFVIDLCPLIFILNFLLHIFSLCLTNLAVIIPLFLFQITFVEVQRVNNTHVINIRKESRFFFIVVFSFHYHLSPLYSLPPSSPPRPATITTPLSRPRSPLPVSPDPSTLQPPQGCQPAIYECPSHSS